MNMPNAYNGLEHFEYVLSFKFMMMTHRFVTLKGPPPLRVTNSFFIWVNTVLIPFDVTLICKAEAAIRKLL
jgi:hypothetical protein